MKLVPHVLTLTPGNFVNNVQEPPWKCEVCGRTFYKYTKKATCFIVSGHSTVCLTSSKIRNEDI